MGHAAPAVRVPRLRTGPPAAGTGRRRDRAASGQAEAKWMQMRAAFSTTRAPTLSSLRRMVANSDQASGILRGTASRSASISQ